jgi:ribosomal protein S18 acetylase RimI-like enzyme
MDEFDDTLQDFIATTTAKPNLSNEELLQKFPEFKGDEALLQSAYDYKATVASGKYPDTTELNSKFPEFFTADVKKKKETEALPKPQPESTTSVSEDTVSDISQPQTTPTSELEGQESNNLPKATKQQQGSAELSQLEENISQRITQFPLIEDYDNTTQVNEEDVALAKQNAQEKLEGTFTEKAVEAATKTSNVINKIFSIGLSKNKPLPKTYKEEIFEEAEAELKKEGQAVTPRNIETKANEISVKNELDEIQDRKINDYVGGLDEDTKKQLEVDKVYNYQTLEMKERAKLMELQIDLKKIEEINGRLKGNKELIERIEKSGESIPKSLVNLHNEKVSIYQGIQKKWSDYEAELEKNNDKSISELEAIDVIKKNYGFLDNIGNAAREGFIRAYGGAVGAVGFVENIRGAVTGSPISKSNAEIFARESQDVFDTVEKVNEGFKDRMTYDKINNLKDLGYFMMQETAAQSATLAQITAAGTTGIVGLGVQTGGEKFASMKDEENNSLLPKEYGLLQEIATPILFGTAEAALGAAPTLSILKRSVSTAGRKLIKEGAVAHTKQFAKDLNWELTTELATTLSHNATDRFVLGDKSVSMLKNMDHTAAQTLASMPVMLLGGRAIGQTIKQFMPKTDVENIRKNLIEIGKLKQMALNLEDETLLPKIQSKIESLQKENETVLVKASENLSKIEKDEFKKIKEISIEQATLQVNAEKIVKDKGLSKNQKKELLESLSKEFSELEETRNRINEGNATLDDLVSDKKELELRNKAVKQLESEKDPEGKGKPTYNLTEQEIVERATEIYNAEKTETTTPKTEIKEVSKETTDFVNELAEKKEDIEDVSEFVGGQLKVTIGDSSVGINSKDDNIVIESISTKEGQRGQGSAKKALTKVIDIADAQGKTIELNVVPLDETTSADGLIKLYEEAGFVKVEGFEKDGGKMVREPKKTQTFEDLVNRSAEGEFAETKEETVKNEGKKGKLEGKKYTTPKGKELSIKIYDAENGEVNSLKERKREDRLSLSMTNEKGEDIGSVGFWKKEDGKWYSNTVWVKDSEQRQGIATALYDFAEQNGFELSTAEIQTEAGKAFKDARDKTPKTEVELTEKEVIKPSKSKPNQVSKPTDTKESSKKEDVVPNSSQIKEKQETKLVKSKKGEFNVTFNEDGNVVKIVSNKTGKETPQFIERKVTPSKKNPQGKILSKNGNYTTIEADAIGVLTNNKSKGERKAKLSKAIDQFNPSDEYGHALEHMARGGKVSLTSAKKETGLSTKEVKWAVGFGDPTKLKSIEAVAEDIVADAVKDDLELSEVRDALIKIIGENESVSQLEDVIIEEYETLNENQNKEEARAYMNSLSDKDFTLINGIIKEDEYLSELSNEEKAEYYEQNFEKPEELNRQPSGSTTSAQEGDGKKNESVFNQDNVKEKLDFLESLKLDPNNLSSTLPFTPQAWNTFIDALKIAVKAGNTIQKAVKIAIRKLQAKGYKEDELKKIANHFAKQSGVDVDLNDIKDSTADFKKKAGKKSVLSRAATGEGNQKIKDALKKHGLDFEVESQDEARERAKAFVKGVGISGAIDAIKSGVLKAGAELAFIYGEVLDILETQTEVATGISKEKLEEDYTRLQEDIFASLDAKARDFGRFISALNKVYNSSYFRYNLSKQILAWEARNSRKIDAETLAKFEERDAKIKDYEKQLVELRKQLEDAQAQEAVDDIKESIDREKDKKKKKPRKKLSDKDQTRKKELFNKYFAFNDATRMLTLLGEADFREYLGLVLKEAGNDLANFSNDIAEQWGETSRKIIPKLFKAAKDQLKTDKENAEDKKRNTLVKKIEDDIKSLDEQIEKGERKVIEKKEDKFANDKEVQRLRNIKNQKQEQLSDIVQENQEYEVFVDEDGKIIIPPQLIRDLVESGITDPNELAQAIKDQYLSDEDVTLREVRDAISGYGKTVNPSKDELSELISEIKNLQRILSGNEDVDEGQRPKRSGYQRRTRTDKERREERKLKDRMRDLPLDDAESEQKWKTQLDAIKSRLQNQIRDLQYQIDNKEKRKSEKTPIEYDQDAKDLVDQRDDLKEQLDAIVGKPELSYEDKVINTEKAIERSIENLEVDIKRNRLAFKIKNSVTSDRITKLRKRQAELRAELNQMREDSGLIEARRLTNRKKAVTKILAELQEKRKNKDYSKKERKELAVDAELKEIQRKYNREKEKYDTEAYKDELKNKHWATKLATRALNFLGLQRLLLATGEFSPMFLQNGVPVVNMLLRAPIQVIKGNPVKLFNMLSSTVKSYSQKEFDKDYGKMEADEDYDLIVKMKVALTRTDAKAAAQEETFQSDVISSAFKLLGEAMDWDGKAKHTLFNTVKKKLGINVSKKDKFSIAEQIQKQDPFKTLERFTTTFGNQIKMDLAKQGIRKLKAEGKNPRDHKEDYLRLGKAVNTLTGRANMNFEVLGQKINLETNSQLLNVLFFSARFFTSTLNKLNPIWYLTVLRDSESTFRNPKVSVAQKLALSQAITYVITTASFVFAVQALGGEDEDGEKDVQVEKDPRSSDFMKIKIGNIRFDPWGGHIPWVVLFARMSSGEMKRTNGQVIKLGEGRNANRFDKLVDFGVGKANPTIATGIRFLRANEEVDGVKRDQWGNEVSIEEELKMMYPIYWQGITEVLAENPEKAKALTYSLVGLGLLGVNNQVYGTSDKALFKSFSKGIKDELNTKRGQFIRPNRKKVTSDAELEKSFQTFKNKHEANYEKLNNRIKNQLKIESALEVGGILKDAGFSTDALGYLNNDKPPKIPLFTESTIKNKLKTIEDRLQNKDKDDWETMELDVWKKANYFNDKAREYNDSLDK